MPTVVADEAAIAHARGRLVIPDRVETLATAAALVVLRELGLVAPVPVWLLIGVLAAGSAVRTITDAVWPGDCPDGQLACRVAVNLLTTGVVVYLTGWGPTLSIGFVYTAAQNIRMSGSRATRPALAAASAAIVAGQIAVETGVAPTMIATPIAHGLGAAALLGTVFAIRLVGSATKRLEETDARKNELVDALRLETDRYESLLRAISDLGEGVLIANERAIVYANDALSRINGYSLSEMQAMRSFLDICVPEEREVIADRLRQRLRGQASTSHYETAINHRDGHRVELEVAVKLLDRDSNTAPHVISVCRDITERKGAEGVLRDALRRERDAGDRLRQLDEMKNGFLQAVSHDLRTPLTVILGLAETLERSESALSRERTAQLVNRLTQNARRLDKLLSNLLDVDRLARGAIAPMCRSTDLVSLFRRVAANIDARGHAIVVLGQHIVADVDPAQIERIVENLVLNAVKHTAPHCSVWLRAQPSPGGVMISVEDDGPGVSEELRTAIFELFRQGDDRSHAPGTGIGLTLVQRFAQLHGGTAWVEDRVGGGARFCVWIPQSEPRSLPAVPAEAGASDAS